MRRELGIARCGLACCLCSENVTCKGCKRDGFLELSWCKDAEWCENRKCVIEKSIAGCYECSPAVCRKGLYAEKIKARAFAEFVRRYGLDELLDCLERNEQQGIVYHREGIMGDYDEFDDLEELISFIRPGKHSKLNESDYVASSLKTDAKQYFKKVTCARCGKEYDVPLKANFMYFCPECKNYNGTECEYGFAPITPCSIFLGSTEIGTIIDWQDSFSLISDQFRINMKLSNGYRDLAVYQEAAAIIKEYLDHDMTD